MPMKFKHEVWIKLKNKTMKTIKKVKNTLIGIDKNNNLFLLDGNGVWQQLNNKQIIKLF